MPKTILLRSGWQTVNIGDIAHTPGMLHLIDKHLPGVDVILWPKSLDRGVEPMLRRRFPRLRIVRDAKTWHSSNPRPDDPTIADAIRQADLYLQGSGSGINESADLLRFRAESGGKPFGALGISVGVVIGVADQKDAVIPKTQRPLLDEAAFLYTRETRSLRALEDAGVRCPRMDFAPDAAFAVDLRNDSAAESLLRRAGLEADNFACFIPRLRNTPYWDSVAVDMHPDVVARKKVVNAHYVELDCGKMRAVIVAWIRRTGKKALLCPEMLYQIGMLKPCLYDPLPDDVKAKTVVVDHYWITDEAMSVYRRARAVVSMECHSPILANAVGRPGFYLRQPEDTWKGQMYPDLGLGAWKFEIETASGDEIAAALLRVDSDYASALSQVSQASARAADRQAAAMRTVGSLLSVS